MYHSYACGSGFNRLPVSRWGSWPSNLLPRLLSLVVGTSHRWQRISANLGGAALSPKSCMKPHLCPTWTASYRLWQFATSLSPYQISEELLPSSIALALSDACFCIVSTWSLWRRETLADQAYSSWWLKTGGTVRRCLYLYKLQVHTYIVYQQWVHRRYRTESEALPVSVCKDES